LDLYKRVLKEDIWLPCRSNPTNSTVYSNPDQSKVNFLKNGRQAISLAREYLTVKLKRGLQTDMRRYWKILVNEMAINSQSWQLIIGVMHDPDDESFLANGFGWVSTGYCTNPRSRGNHKSKSTHECQLARYGPGDSIGVYLDLRSSERSISFYKNNQKLETSYQSIPEKNFYYLFVTFGGLGSSVSFIGSTPEPPS